MEAYAGVGMLNVERAGEWCVCARGASGRCRSKGAGGYDVVGVNRRQSQISCLYDKPTRTATPHNKSAVGAACTHPTRLAQRQRLISYYLFSASARPDCETKLRRAVPQAQAEWAEDVVKLPAKQSGSGRGSAKHAGTVTEGEEKNVPGIGLVS